MRDREVRDIIIALISFIAGGIVVFFLFQGQFQNFLPAEFRSPLYKYKTTNYQYWIPDRWDRKLLIDDCVQMVEKHFSKSPLMGRIDVFEECMRENGFRWEDKENK